MRGEEKSRGYRVIAEKVDDKVSGRANISIEKSGPPAFPERGNPAIQEIGAGVDPPLPPFSCGCSEGKRDDFTESPQSRFFLSDPLLDPFRQGDLPRESPRICFSD